MSSSIQVHENLVKEQVDVGKAMLHQLSIQPAVFERVALNALITNPDLGRCTAASFERALIQCVQTGLLPDGKQAAIVPYGTSATLIPMIRGRLSLARRATPGISFRLKVVYRDEPFEYREGLHAVLRHKPDMSVSRRAKDLVAAYAVAVMPGAAEPEFVVLFRSDIERHRSFSRAKNGIGWTKSYAAMARKTAGHQLCNQLPDMGGLPEVPEELMGYQIEDEMPSMSATATVDTPEDEDEDQDQDQDQASASASAAKPKPKPKPKPSDGTKRVPNAPGEDPEDDSPF